MSDFIDVSVVAKAVVPKRRLSRDDRHVEGVYSVMVAKGLPTPSAASAALDAFHSECAVETLDDFEFFVFDPRSGLALDEDPDHESYSKCHLGRDVQRVGDSPPKKFTVTVEARGDDGKTTALGTRVVVAHKRLEARGKAHELLWDPRLDAASCSPRYQVELV